MPTASRVEIRSGARARVARAWAGHGPLARPLSALLLPAERLFRLGVAARNRAYDSGWLRVRRAALPVVSVGNLAVGGTGKTPFSAWVAAHYAGAGERPTILHGGYAADEPALHRRWNPGVPVLEGRDRLLSAERAAAQGATVAILDDGFQHRRLERDLDIVLVAAETWEGPHALLPRGPWREPPASLRRADIVVVTRKAADAGTAARVLTAVGSVAPGVTCCAAAIEPVSWDVSGADGGEPPGPCLAVAGLAAPEIFLENARAAGADVTGALLFGDHHAYSEADARRIAREAGDRSIVTTEKDALKLAARLPGAPLWVLQQAVRIETGAAELIRRLDGIRQ